LDTEADLFFARDLRTMFQTDPLVGEEDLRVGDRLQLDLRPRDASASLRAKRTLGLLFMAAATACSSVNRSSAGDGTAAIMIHNIPVTNIKRLILTSEPDGDLR